MDILNLLDVSRKIIITPSIYSEEEVNLHLRDVKDEIARIENLPKIFVLTIEEASLLLNYLTYGVGYIAHEFEWAGIHQIYDKLNENINGKKEFKPSKGKEKTELT